MIPGQQSRNQTVQSFKITFGEDVSLLLQPENRDGARTLNYFQRLAKQLNIRNFDVREILSEATMRGLDSIDRKEEPIKSASAWLRSVGTKIIKDQVRAEIKSRKLVEKHSYRSETADSWIKLVLAEEGIAAHQAIMLLSPDDQEILRLRFIKAMPYKDIQAHYLRETGVSIKEPTLRKRESRAVAKLRFKFKEIYE